ncbi:MAG TPA: PRTRC system ThiF family protein [Chitinophagaceae bacterium]|nr:PRTRC system ThiF family protein [Chitinophagaceae bacterium]
MKVHVAHPYLRNPPHKITVAVAGIGGTGSQVLTGLGRINEALLSMGHPGLHVRAYDNDQVTSANIGRQLFSTSDLGHNKAVVLTTRINRFYGLEWEAVPEIFGGQCNSNITISCIDTAMGRVMMGMKLESVRKTRRDDPEQRLYWMDLGNLQKTGQVILGTLVPVEQPKGVKNTRANLKTVTSMFPQLKTIQEDKLGPSCSLAEALNKQDLFINSTLAQFGCGLIWKLFREGSIRYHGCYLNLDSFIVNPIKIK